MSDFQRWLVRRIALFVVTQGGHKDRIVEFYKILTVAAREQFTEDTKPSLDSFLEECHTLSLKDK